MNDFEVTARRILPEPIFRYVDRAAGSGETHKSNLAAFGGYGIIPRVLTGVVAPTTSVTVLGREISAPVMIAPTAWHSLYTPGGETAAYRAARAFGTVMTLSCFSTKNFHALDAGAALQGIWFQLLMHKDLGVLKAAAYRAREAGCEAVVITVDAPTGCAMCKGGAGEVALPPSELPLLPRPAEDESRDLDEYYRENLDPGQVTWKQLSSFCEISPLPVMVKGVLHPDDARRAAECGARGIIVSNHGGRQMDHSVSALDALRTITESFVPPPEFEILMDGGVRSGADVFKACSFGARAVLLGRPVLYALAADGEAGVSSMLSELRSDLHELLAQVGVRNPSELHPGMLYRRPAR